MGAGGQFATFADKLDDATMLGKAAHGAQNLLNKGATAIGNTAIGGKVISGASKVLTGAGNFVDEAALAIGSKAGSGAIGTAIANGAWNVIGNGASIVGTSAGAIAGASTQFKANAASNQADLILEEINNPSVAQQLYTDTQEVLKGEDALPDAATEEEAAENIEKLKEQGYTPGGTEAPVETQAPAETQAPESTPKSTTGDVLPGPSSTSQPTQKPTVTAPEVTIPSYTTQPPVVTTPAATTPAPTNPEQQVISTISPISPTPTSGPTGPSNPNISNLTDPTKVDETTKDMVSSEVLDTFGNVSGSLSGVSSSKTSIPSSSSPILSSDGGSGAGSKLVPLGAGLGAASVAGIGAKAYLDKREKSSEEDEDELETEEWASQDDMEIDYGLETDSEEADYLSPTDELAFTE